MTQRKKPTTVVGVPPMEDFSLGLASERISVDDPQTSDVDMHLPAEGIFRNLVLV
jgi:4-hydroxy-3-polyprenylbenzoate decarboxylase